MVEQNITEAVPGSSGVKLITSASLDSSDNSVCLPSLQHARCMSVQTHLNVYRSLKAQRYRAR